MKNVLKKISKIYKKFKYNLEDLARGASYAVNR